MAIGNNGHQEMSPEEEADWAKMMIWIRHLMGTVEQLERFDNSVEE